PHRTVRGSIGGLRLALLRARGRCRRGSGHGQRSLRARAVLGITSRSRRAHGRTGRPARRHRGRRDDRRAREAAWPGAYGAAWRAARLTRRERMRTIVIGDKNLSSWSMRPWLALAKCGVPFDEIVIRLDRPDTKARLAAETPHGKVPVLREDGLVIWESLAIC